MAHRRPQALDVPSTGYFELHPHAVIDREADALRPWPLGFKQGLDHRPGRAVGIDVDEVQRQVGAGAGAQAPDAIGFKYAPGRALDREQFSLCGFFVERDALAYFAVYALPHLAGPRVRLEHDRVLDLFQEAQS